MPRAAFYLVFVASGLAGLIYESLWTHYLKLFLGHAAYAQSLVLAVFMGAMAAGAWIAARFTTRLANPLRVYAAVEGLIGLFALFFHPVFVAVTDWSYASLLPALGTAGGALMAKLALCALLIAPQSLLLGMTFPLMSAGLARAERKAAGESVAMLYFTNSLGAAIGVLASGFVLIGEFGLPGTMTIAACMNIALAVLVWLASRGARGAAVQETARGETGAGLLLGVAFFTGLASFVYEISWIRMLSLVLGASTHSFELMLAVFVLGLAFGGLAVRRRADGTAPERSLAWVQIAMGLAASLTLPLYDFTFGWMETIMGGLAHNDTGYFFFNAAGAAISGLIMLPATFLAGMTLPLLTGALLRKGAGEAAIGRVYAANTLGAIAGVVLAVHAGLPLLGLKGTLLFGALVDVALGLALLGLIGRRKALAGAAAACAALFLALALGVELDANKMTAGVFRYGDLAASSEAQVLFKKDGKTATVHLVKYPEATSLRTNGKSDGSINLDAQGERGTDEITMVLTGALPLALKPETRTAAVIGIGTGLTMHTLLQSLDIERVETVEIESAMAEASRGFMPRNSGAFADPRGAIVIDDAKSYFAAGQRRYDVIVSEPSNPWVSGVSGLFTREFYRRIRGHLAPGGMLVQWFQLYEIHPSRVASVMRALGEEFAHYAVFAPSDHDLLIVASESEIPLPAQARVFEQPGVAKELWTVHVLTAGDFDARYVGSRATLEPLFASYGVPANSDYEPFLDLNAARDRFTEKSAMSIVGLVNADVPLLDILEPGRSRRPANPLFRGSYAFERVENSRLAWYARNMLVSPRGAEPDNIPAQFEKDLEIVRLRLIECRQPREFDVWLNSALRVARGVNPYLSQDDAGAIWLRIARSPCFADLYDYQKNWLALFRAVAARDLPRMAQLGSRLLSSGRPYGADAREYLLSAAMTGFIADGQAARALELWNQHAKSLPERVVSSPSMRLLRCHAERFDLPACAAAFRAYAER
jgi:predicted membrane-bound spermidine synthase